jgi:putative ABC transport system permease protein
MHVAPLVTAIAVGFDTLRANPLRTILSTLGVIIGVSALVAVLSVGDGMERSVRAQIAQTTDLQAIAISAKTHEEVDGQSFPLANPVQLSAADAKRIRALEGVKSVTLATSGVGEVRNGLGTVRKMAAVVSELALSDSATMKIASGRFLTEKKRRVRCPWSWCQQTSRGRSPPTQPPLRSLATPFNWATRRRSWSECWRRGRHPPLGGA